VTHVVELAGERFTVEPVHRLALAVVPTDALTRGSARGICVGREVANPPVDRRRRRGAPLGRSDGRFDLPLEQRGTSAFTLLHRLDLPLPPPGSPPVGEVVIRIADPQRRYVPRRLRVPLWSRRRVEESDADPPTGSRVAATARSVRPWLLPGPASQPPLGTTGLRGQVRRDDGPVPWPRVRALGGADELLGHAHGDDRGEFLLVLTTTGVVPPPPPSSLPIRLQVWIPDPSAPPPPDQLISEDDPLGGLVIEDAVRRDVGAVPGSIDGAVLRGLTIPPSYVLAAVRLRPPEAFAVGEFVQPDPYVIS
jgi:hypothetical protein